MSKEQYMTSFEFEFIGLSGAVELPKKKSKKTSFKRDKKAQYEDRLRILKEMKKRNQPIKTVEVSYG